MARRIRRTAVLVSVLILAAPVPAAGEPPAVAAASSLRFALDEVAALYEGHTRRQVRITYGSSGNIARQILQGAPFQLFLAADEVYAERLTANGLTEGPGVVYAEGRIVFFTPSGSSVTPDPALRDLSAAVADGRLGKLAMGNPQHAPYGRAAREALVSAGLWERVRPRIVYGENAGQAARFIITGAADGGFAPYALAVAPPMAEKGAYALVSAARHAPLRQRMVLVKGAGDAARRFYAFVLTGPAMSIFERYGFARPEPRQRPR